MIAYLAILTSACAVILAKRTRSRCLTIVIVLVAWLLLVYAMMRAMLAA